MKVPAISTHYIGRNERYKNDNQTTTNTISNKYENNNTSPFISDSYGRAMLNMNNNSPNFGFAVTAAFIATCILLTGLLCTTITIYSLINCGNHDTDVDEEGQQKALDELTKEYKTDIEKISRSMGKDKKEAEKYYNNYLQASYIKQKKGHETGMNAVMGYTLEKYQIMKDLLSPMALAQKTSYPQVRELVPNGVLLYGPSGTGKTYIAQKIGEHMKHFGTNVVDLDVNSAGRSEEAKIQLVNSVFDKAKQDFENTGKYTIININGQAGIFEKRKNNRNPNLLDTFLQRLDQSAKNGAVAVITINEPEFVDRALLRKGRVDLKMPIGKMEKFENAEMINFALYNNSTTKNYARTFDYKKVINEMEKNKWAFTPAEFLNFVKQMDRDNEVNADKMVDLMKKLTGETKKDPEKPSLNDAELSPERREEFKQKIDFVNNVYDEEINAAKE